ncbi:MAG: Fe-S cluster assembly protein HesB [candidate division SR1 bacterium]|nr:Fe-S cluster assembly protein HesB [candidate division SR1 bacterium]
MTKDIKIIQKNILSWYAKHGRNLPRRQITDPYAIHVSEVMLQQTQVDRVIPYFHQRMKDFPDYATLAQASKTDLLKHRSGLGFNSRALRLQECAKVVTKNVGANTIRLSLPKDRLELQKLPGIGPYTSAAIMSFAWNVSVPVIDTNIRRVLIFLFKLPETISAKALEAFAETVIPKGKSRDRHNALMDQGALLLTARKTKIKSLSKQSKFEGSDRQVRGWTLKQLVKHGELNIKDIEKEFPQKDVKKIVKDLQKESLIVMKKNRIVIA